MATSSRLKTADGKYYATEDFVKNYINENESLITDELSGKLSGMFETEVNDLQTEINEKANKEEVYTKEEVSEIISGLLTMNTIN